jgi:ABC-type multidrug transport system fused ATPase/permease subunit
VLFQGTVRKDLDPFSQKCDEDLWSALKISGTIKSGEEIEEHTFHLAGIVGDDFTG